MSKSVVENLDMAELCSQNLSLEQHLLAEDELEELDESDALGDEIEVKPANSVSVPKTCDRPKQKWQDGAFGVWWEEARRRCC